MLNGLNHCCWVKVHNVKRGKMPWHTHTHTHTHQYPPIFSSTSLKVNVQLFVSCFGAHEDLQRLIGGIMVLFDTIVSAASRNATNGSNQLNGLHTCFFHHGSRGAQHGALLLQLPQVTYKRARRCTQTSPYCVWCEYRERDRESELHLPTVCLPITALQPDTKKAKPRNCLSTNFLTSCQPA